jgi:diaminopimelate epimerase
MTRLSFTKLSGAGNDFILVDGSLPRLPPAPALARRLCCRRSGVGADGLLVVRRDGPSVAYYNADGSKAFCGNGTRCAAWWMHLRRWAGRDFSMRTISGPVAAQITGSERVRLTMPLPKSFRWNLRLAAAGRIWKTHFLEVGVPHAVVEVEKIDPFPIVEIGRALRHHKAFRPHGANIDFILKSRVGKTRKPLPIRTYERGVEDETLACGTGAVASAFCAYFLYGAPSPVRIATRGGDVLTADFKTVRDQLTEAWLEGPARITFQGEVTL